MIYINLVFLLLILILFLISRKEKNDLFPQINKKEHKLYFLYPLAAFLVKQTGLEKAVTQKARIKESIKALYITGKPELLTNLFRYKQISVMLIILVLFNLLSVFAVVSEKDNSRLIDGKYIRRPDYGEGSTNVDLSLTVRGQGDDKTSEEEEVSVFSDLTIRVGEQAYTEEEVSVIFEKSFEYLKKAVLGENQSNEAIYDNLNFINTIPGTGIKVAWKPEDYRLIQTDGTIKKENIGPEEVSTPVTVILSYGDRDHKYTKEYTMSFKVMPGINSEEEILLQKLREEIGTAQEKTREDKYLELPGSLDQYHLIWADSKKGSSLTMLLLGIILAAAVWIFGDKELDKQMKIRKEQMLMDYPEIINKFTLLVNAGMTIKQAWTKLAEDYSLMKAKKGNSIRYAYEEILLTVHELKLGLPEEGAYEQFGKRTGLTAYMKFCSLITQNLKKGTKGFTELLMHEAMQAFEERKEVARRLGEEAGTKLLIPMLVMLIIVFLIILIPAFMSFRI